MKSSRLKLFNLLGAIVTAALVTTIVSRPNGATVIRSMGDAFSGPIRAAMGEEEQDAMKSYRLDEDGQYPDRIFKIVDNAEWPNPQSQWYDHVNYVAKSPDGTSRNVMAMVPVRKKDWQSAVGDFFIAVWAALSWWRYPPLKKSSDKQLIQKMNESYQVVLRAAIDPPDYLRPEDRQWLAYQKGLTYDTGQVLECEVPSMAHL